MRADRTGSRRRMNVPPFNTPEGMMNNPSTGFRKNESVGLTGRQPSWLAKANRPTRMGCRVRRRKQRHMAADMRRAARSGPRNALGTFSDQDLAESRDLGAGEGIRT